jgi:peroxiredoxin Q/BCP
VATKKKTKAKRPAKKPAVKARAGKRPAAKKTATKKAKAAPNKAAAKSSKIDPSTIAAKPAPKAGASAPSFVLPGSDGQTHDLGELRGKSVVLYFYPKDDTPGCTIEACSFRDKIGAFEAKNAVVLGVSRDSVEKHEKFRTKHGLPFTLLSDPEGKVISAYGSWGEKSFMGRRFMGILRTTVLIGPDGKVKKVYGKVSPKTHADEVLADL